jgi:hypothetical protein
MKKRVMLAMAIVMLLGSVKAMAETDEMLTNDAMIENALTKSETAEANAADKAAEAKRAEIEMLVKIRSQIIELKASTKDFDEVKVGSETVSAGQALFAAEADYSSLISKFDMKHAKSVSKILADSIKSLPKSK